MTLAELATLPAAERKAIHADMQDRIRERVRNTERHSAEIINLADRLRSVNTRKLAAYIPGDRM